MTITGTVVDFCRSWYSIVNPSMIGISRSKKNPNNRFGPEYLKSLQDIRGCRHFKPEFLQSVAKKQNYGFLVIDNENAFAHENSSLMLDYRIIIIISIPSLKTSKENDETLDNRHR